jgi:hypothetical protein
MNGCGPCGISHSKNFIGIQIGTDFVETFSTAQFFGQGTMGRMFIHIGINTDKIQAEFDTCLNDTDCDFASIGDKDFMVF